MNYQLLKEQLADSSRALADLTAGMVYNNPGLLKELLEVSWLDEDPWCKRASRIVSICGCEKPELLKSYWTSIIGKLAMVKSESVRRNFLKIFVEIDIRLKEKDRDKLLNLCFDFLNGASSVGVKVYSMDILYKLSSDFPELMRELGEIVENQMPGSSAGFRSRGAKVITRIRNNLNLNSHTKGNAEDR